MMAGGIVAGAGLSSAATKRECERHRRMASESAALPMNSPGGHKTTLLLRLRLPSEGLLPGEATFFKARKLSQPQSSCIYTSIGVSRIFQCFLVYLAGKTPCRRLPVSV